MAAEWFSGRSVEHLQHEKGRRGAPVSPHSVLGSSLVRGMCFAHVAGDLFDVPVMRNTALEPSAVSEYVFP